MTLTISQQYIFAVAIPPAWWGCQTLAPGLQPHQARLPPHAAGHVPRRGLHRLGIRGGRRPGGQVRPGGRPPSHLGCAVGCGGESWVLLPISVTPRIFQFLGVAQRAVIRIQSS